MPGLENLKGVGPKRLQALGEAGIRDVEGLLDYLPRAYLYAQEATMVAQVKAGEVCLEGKLIRQPGLQYFSGRSIVRTELEDESGRIRVFWFNQPWMAKGLKKGQDVVLYGHAQAYQGALGLVNPKIIREKGIQPVYRPLPGLPGKLFSHLIAQALDGLDEGSCEILPEALRRKHGLCGKREALRMAHFPLSVLEVDTAKRRLAFENLLLYQVALSLLGPRGQPGPNMGKDQFRTADYWARIPFQATKAQEKALSEIIMDMTGGTAMRRLMQGDVGSGKTAVALGVAACAINAGYQCAFMAPTELLARQHFMTASRLLKPLGIACGLLTGSMRVKERQEALEKIQSGEWELVIGTHALISRDVAYCHLGLVITDEQHRFGVKQRQALVDRAGETYNAHMLALSATPIPRSLALVLYGDMQVSVIDELPPGRQAVKTRVVPETKRAELYNYIRDKAINGEQSFLVCPLVEDSEESEAKSAVSLYRQLLNGPLNGIAVGLTYGAQEKAGQEKALGNFYAGETMVLVSTTVIEVGMDVPNATTMVVEDAERFGLAQLHQLRGRVGRGDKESWCFLMGEKNERLDMMTKTNDGFLIAQKDLELRGPGEFLGTRQSGLILDAYGVSDVRLVEETHSLLDEMQGSGGDETAWLLLQMAAEHKYAVKLAEAGLH
jgi:ATP-dependent DNA helicase RecG